MLHHFAEDAQQRISFALFCCEGPIATIPCYLWRAANNVWPLTCLYPISMPLYILCECEAPEHERENRNTSNLKG